MFVLILSPDWQCLIASADAERLYNKDGAKWVVTGTMADRVQIDCPGAYTITAPRNWRDIVA